jgi:hypothetical protein
VLLESKVEIIQNAALLASMGDVSKVLLDQVQFSVEFMMKIRNQRFSLGDAIRGSVFIGESGRVVMVTIHDR